MRLFEAVNQNLPYYIPERKTKYAAGYDFSTPYEVDIHIGEIVIIKTNIKCKMNFDDYLQLSVRSGLSTKGLFMVNSPGIIDYDYYNNSDNGGEIGAILCNVGRHIIHLEAGTRIMQGIFQKYYTLGTDNITTLRKGGFGSTGK